MSVCVVVRTERALAPAEVFDHLMKRGERILIKSDEFPSVQFGTLQKAIRGIEINQEPNGYEVRVCTYASVADLQLFVVAIQALIDLTGGRAYLEDDGDDEISDVRKNFDEAWIDEQREASFRVTRALTKHSGHPVMMYGLFCRFCIGAEMYRRFGISLTGDCSREQMDKLQDYLCSVQWYFANKKDTSTQLVVAPESSNEEGLTISGIFVKDGVVKPFDYISEANLLGIIDMDDQAHPPVLIPFKEAWKILPRGVFRPIDEWQYERVGELSVEMVHQMMNRARHLQPDDLHYRPMYPGGGWDDKQNTIILTWDPEDSGFSITEHNEQIASMLTDFFYWEVHEHETAKWGDRFYLVKIGAGETGVVMSGVFTSQPYKFEDAQGRTRYYMDMHPNFILDPIEAPMLTTESLSRAIPSFDWSGSGILSSEDAKSMEDLWANYIDGIREHIDGQTINVINVAP